MSDEPTLRLPLANIRPPEPAPPPTMLGHGAVMAVFAAIAVLALATPVVLIVLSGW